jgi:signal transduction histidine kinase
VDNATLEVLAVARSVLEDLDTEAVLERVLSSARDLTGAQYAALGVLDETRTELSRFLTVGIDDETRREIGPLPRGRGVLGELIRESRSLRLDDVSLHQRSYGFPSGHPPMKSFLGVPVMIGEEPYGNLYLTDKRGGEPFTDKDEQALATLAGFAGVAIDHAQRFTGAEQRRAELQRTVDALDAMQEIARAVGGETDLRRILELVAKRGRALVSARALVVELRDGAELVVATGAGDLPREVLGMRVPMQNTLAAAAMRAGRTQRLGDELNRARFDQHGLGGLGLEAKDALVVPLLFRNQFYGALVAVDPEDGPTFSSDHERLLESFAASAAIAVATAQTGAQERQLQRLAATEAERARWARELHDQTLQALGSLSFVLGAGQRAGGVSDMRAAMSEAVAQIGIEIANLRNMITDLRPAELDALGLEPAIDALAARLHGTSLSVEVVTDLAHERGRVAQRLIPELEAAIYRVVQESLTNASKHAGDCRAVVEVEEDERAVRVVVRDDGRGFDPDVSHEGFGLLGIRERVELFGGTLAIDSAQGAGTTVRLTFPAYHVGSPNPLLEAGRLVGLGA